MVILPHAWKRDASDMNLRVIHNAQDCQGLTNGDASDMNLRVIHNRTLALTISM